MAQQKTHSISTTTRNTCSLEVSTTIKKPIGCTSHVAHSNLSEHSKSCLSLFHPISRIYRKHLSLTESQIRSHLVSHLLTLAITPSINPSRLSNSVFTTLLPPVLLPSPSSFPLMDSLAFSASITKK